MTLLLLGASGFIGQSVLKKLINLQDIRLHCTRLNLTGKEPFQTEPNVTWHAIDIIEQHSELIPLVKASDVIINCTGELNLPERMRAINFEFVQKLVDYITLTDHTQHFIQLSSVGCYGAVKRFRGNTHTVIEDSHESPAGEYEVTKTMADDYIRNQFKSINENKSYTLIRPTNVFGQHMKSQALLSLANMVKKGRFFYIGDQNNISTYIHVDDVAELFIKCIEQPKKSKNQYFIASNDCLQRELIEAMANYYETTPPRMTFPEGLLRLVSLIFNTLKLPFPLNETRIDSLTSKVEFSSQKAQKMLNFKPSASVPAQIPLFLKQSR